jgi:hypothetical protein
MIGGFALAPSNYRITGVMTLIVSHDGVVYQKDRGSPVLGPSCGPVCLATASP